MPFVDWPVLRYSVNGPTWLDSLTATDTALDEPDEDTFDMTSLRADAGVPVDVSGNAMSGLQLALHAIEPNPFRRVARIEFDLPRTTVGSLDLFDVAGRHVAVISSGTWVAGRHVVKWSSRNDGGGKVASGIYFMRLSVGGQERCQRVVVIE